MNHLLDATKLGRKRSIKFYPNLVFYNSFRLNWILPSPMYVSLIKLLDLYEKRFLWKLGNFWHGAILYISVRATGEKKRKTLCMLHSTAGRMQFTSGRYDCVPSLYLMKRPDCAVYCVICRSRYIYISQLPIEKKKWKKKFQKVRPCIECARCHWKDWAVCLVALDISESKSNRVTEWRRSIIPLDYSVFTSCDANKLQDVTGTVLLRLDWCEGRCI